MKCSEECFLVALIYIDKLNMMHYDVTVDQRSVHRLFLTALVLAAKFYDDRYYKNSYYSRVGGIPNVELN